MVGQKQFCFLQYTIDHSEKEFDVLCHGNAKSNAKYKQTAVSVRKKIKDIVQKRTPREALNVTRKELEGTVNARSPAMLPRNMNQVKYLSRGGPSSLTSTSKDVLASLMENCKQTMNCPNKIFIRKVEGPPEPMSVIGTEAAFMDLERFCCTAPQGLNSVLTIDPTFNFGTFTSPPPLIRIWLYLGDLPVSQRLIWALH